MSKCIIVGAGDFDVSLLPEREKDDLLIAADGGYTHLKNASLVPDICVGDFDSLGYTPKNCQILTLPVEKDDTDMVACARMGLEKGYSEFKFLGVLGGRRFSHSLAAVQTLHWLTKNGARGEILDKSCRILTAQNETLHFGEDTKGEISLFSLTDKSVVTEGGLHYEVERQTLTSAYPLGVSNNFTGKKASITVHEGVCAIIIEEKI